MGESGRSGTSGYTNVQSSRAGHAQGSITCRKSPSRRKFHNSNFGKVPSGPPITWSQGYPALVRSCAPNDTILQWDADTVECPGIVYSVYYHPKNFGTEDVTICAPVEPESPSFSRVTDCECYSSLGAGQMSPCSLRIEFHPTTVLESGTPFHGWMSDHGVRLSGVLCTGQQRSLPTAQLHTGHHLCPRRSDPHRGWTVLPSGGGYTARR